MVSIADVAARAGVSPTTVSHALSGKRKVSDRVRARVESAMQELGYVPSRSAQNLAIGRTRLLGLIVPDIRNSFFADLTHGVEATAIGHGYNVILCTTGFDHTREVDHLAMIRSRAVDGLIYAAGAPPTNSQLGALLGDLPLVLVDEEVPGAIAPSFVSDNLNGGRLAAEHLLGLGHRRALVIAADGGLVSSDLRVEGFRESWVAEGAETPVIASGAFTEEGGREAIARHAEAFGGEGPTAVFAVNDLMAFGAIGELQRAGIDVPGRVSVVGFDDIPAGRYAHPRLTTVRQDVDELGRRATHALIAALDDEPAGPKDRPGRHVLPVSLTVRQSTAPPPAAQRKADSRG
ncbi:LacI family DNA-binding transcriptional regulator [Streptomyces radicis]|uniref:LacI family transcriptional regulator n=1 Tax=Streptomyces radicis TaxID=1750517 RepID=A0A3A9VR34_9ACTN|nr:LacI family DNA-binding transcriptional regulator [Streptomyces radicis]RKN03581.1 LacI family transcriptional regulator [Streptomyces radicis]RKN13442.1 LacI family transcriptional regulator [Streptomyces radicis]